MAKYEFVKETNIKGEVTYYTTKDGRYVNDSLSYNIEAARAIFNTITKYGGVSLKEVIEVHETETN